MRFSDALSLGIWLCLAVSTPQTAYGENPVGRYAIVTLPTKPGSFDSRVMILDTADGHLWQWWEAPAVGNTSPNSGITYLGRVTPGSTTIEMTPLHRGGGVEPIVPRH